MSFKKILETVVLVVIIIIFSFLSIVQAQETKDTTAITPLISIIDTTIAVPTPVASEIKDSASFPVTDTSTINNSTTSSTMNSADTSKNSSPSVEIVPQPTINSEKSELPPDQQSTISSPTPSTTESSSSIKKFYPEIGIGVGLMTFHGDVGYKNLNQPLRYRMGYNFYQQESLFPFLDASVFLLIGRLYGNERDSAASKNYNFESKTVSGGINFTYNFLKPFYAKRTKPAFIMPYVSIGAELIGFTTYSDLKDTKDRIYYYWNNGYIKDKPQNAPDAASAVVLTRDYTYETRVRNETTMGFPVGAGITFHVANRISINFGSTYHFIQSDLIDYVKDGGNDAFFFTSCTFRYNFATPRYIDEKELHYKDVDYIALEKEDSDGDGVPDLKDLCPNTPLGVTVDINGCPPDDDGDGIPNYLDKEPGSARGALVDEHGITITEEYIAKQLAAEDSLEAANTVRSVTYSPEDSSIVVSPSSSTSPYSSVGEEQSVTYKVRLGTFKKDGIPTEMIDKFIDIQDISSKTDSNDMTTYTAGSYLNKIDADKRRKELVKEGIKEASVVAIDKEGKTVALNTITKTLAKSKTPVQLNPNSPFPTSTSYNFEYKVQIGVFKQKPPQTIFNEIETLSTEKTPEGTKYMGGSFNSYKNAVAYKTKLREKGFPDAFIVIYKSGKRVSIKQFEEKSTQ